MRLVVLSPRSVRSDWVKFEVECAFRYKSEMKIIPVLLETCEPALLHERLPKLRMVDHRDDWAKLANELSSAFELNDVS